MFTGELKDSSKIWNSFIHKRSKNFFTHFHDFFKLRDNEKFAIIEFDPEIGKGV